MSAELKKKLFVAGIAKVLVPLTLIVAGGVAWAYFKATAPVIQRGAPQRQVAVVQTRPAVQKAARTRVSAMGTVTAARQVTLKARVAGEVQSVADQFIPGGRIAKGARLLSLDPADLQVALQKARSALEDARAALALEQGSQTIAREELRLLTELSAENIAQSDLALRKPQLQQAQAAVSAAEADLRQARLNLERTVVRVPFNALIIERQVNVGAYVGAQESLATIVGTDEFWVEAMVSLDQLALIDIHHPGGCPAQVRSQSEEERWPAKVVRIAGKLNETSRMATVIVAVADPLGLRSDRHGPRLMIDDYVQVELTGRRLDNVIELPRAALQDGDSVWVCTDNTLDIRPVTLAWKSADAVYVSNGLAAGELVVVSELATPVQGMPLKIADSPSADMQGDQARKKAQS